MTGLFERLRGDEGQGGVAEEARQAPEPAAAQPEQAGSGGLSGAAGPAYSSIGIDELMSKRAKLEEAIDYVGLMIRNMREKKTGLEKEIESELVNIKKLDDQLAKVRQYIDEERRGIEELARKRAETEAEADRVRSTVGQLRDSLTAIDEVVSAEGVRVKSFKDSQSGQRPPS